MQGFIFSFKSPITFNSSYRVFLSIIIDVMLIELPLHSKLAILSENPTFLTYHMMLVHLSAFNLFSTILALCHTKFSVTLMFEECIIRKLFVALFISAF
jgi:hypothetical protein